MFQYWRNYQWGDALCARYGILFSANHRRFLSCFPVFRDEIDVINEEPSEDFLRDMIKIKIRIISPFLVVPTMLVPTSISSIIGKLWD